MTRRGILTMVTAAALVAAFAVFMFVVDPMQAPWFPRCPSKLITGYDCPGCGSSRALHALVHGDLHAAWHYNAAIFFAIPLMALLVAGKLAGPTSRLRRIAQHPAIPATATVAIIVWGIARNL